MPYKNKDRQAAYMRKYRRENADEFRGYNRKSRGKRILPFVAIDSEGISYGEKIKIGNELAQPQRTVFWGAGNSDNCEWLDGSPFCSASSILDWLCDLPDHFGPSIFVWFGSSYDATQIFLDLPFEKAWELQHGKSFDDRFNAEPGRSGRYVFFEGYAISYIKQKCLRIGELSNERNSQGKIKFKRQITIYDVFGFFQTSFIKSAKSIPGSMIDNEAEIIAEGKADRSAFTFEKIPAMKIYTECELKVLARMMETLRTSLTDMGISLTRWQGAGSIAAAMMKKHGAKDHFLPVETKELSEAQQWAHFAFFGGRIELMKQGCTVAPLWIYDIKSAYPAEQSELPSMKDGIYVEVLNPTREQIESCNKLSMFEVEFECRIDEGTSQLNSIHGFSGPEFYPFPYRDTGGRITFPHHVKGIYMRDEISAAFAWLDYWQYYFFERTGRSIRLPCKITIKRGLIFKSSDEPGMGWIRNYFNQRLSIQEVIELTGIYNATEKVIKLGINSLYGKTAQSVGNQGKAPSTANPWYAAAITAGTRAKLLRAALSIPPGAIVAFQTDGIVTTKPLEIIEIADLGGWEKKEITGRSIFVQPGIYHYKKTPKHRGIKRELLGIESDEDWERWLVENVVAGWKKNKAAVEYPYRYYVTLGAAVASEDRFRVAGHWIDSTRQIQLNSLGFKRGTSIYSDELKKRASRLVDTFPKPAYYHASKSEDWELPFSEPHRPQWLDADAAAANELERLNEEIALTEG